MTNQPEQLTEEQKLESVMEAFNAWKGDYDLLFCNESTKGGYKHQVQIEPSVRWDTFVANKIDSMFMNIDFCLGVPYLAGVSKSDRSQMRILKGPQYLGANRESGETLFISGKPAKMIKKILPYLTEQDCQDFANWWKDTFCQKSDLVVKTGKDRESFKKAYTSKVVKDSYFEYRSNGVPIKSLNGSCMQGESKGFNGIHPAEVYASGDFFIAWTEDSRGLLHSRVVVHEKEDSIDPGSIYTASKAGADILENYLADMGKPIKDNDWYRARLLKIEKKYDSGTYLCPYLDCRGSVSDLNDKYLVIDGNGTDSDTSGYIKLGPQYTCDDCGVGIDEDSMYSGAHGDGCYCESCYNDLFFYCDQTCETLSVEDGVTFWTQGCWGNNREMVCEEWASENGAIPDGKEDYYEFDMLVEVQGDWYLADSDDIFCSDKSNEHFFINERVELPDGECWHIDELKEEQKDEDCPWCLVNGKACLKDNWEMPDGTPIKNPQLDLESYT